MIRTPRAGTLALALLLFPAAAGAQARPSNSTAPRVPSAEEVRGWMTELQQIGARLQAAHSRALQDPQLRRAQDALMRDMQEAMLRVDPELDRLADRARAIPLEVQGAQQAGDRTRAAGLLRELQGIQQRVMRAEALVLRQPAFAARTRGYEELLRREMTKSEPELDRLLDRSRDLKERVERVLRQRRQPEGPRRRTP
ncbi:MAG TPA: hypothetical protein VFX98_13540 [Longimicrobiaceae bacterium]|nr:hypothetical protein [Longimicrobiaceae bacterium]